MQEENYYSEIHEGLNEFLNYFCFFWGDEGESPINKGFTHFRK